MQTITAHIFHISTYTVWRHVLHVNQTTIHNTQIDGLCRLLDVHAEALARLSMPTAKINFSCTNTPERTTTSHTCKGTDKLTYYVSWETVQWSEECEVGEPSVRQQGPVEAYQCRTGCYWLLQKHIFVVSELPIWVMHPPYNFHAHYTSGDT